MDFLCALLGGRSFQVPSKLPMIQVHALTAGARIPENSNMIPDLGSEPPLAA